MALAQFEFIFTIKDDKNKEAETSVYAPSGFTKAALQIFAGLMAKAIDDIVSGKVVAAEFGVLVDISTLTGNTAALSSDVEEKAVFQSVTLDGTSVDFTIPGLNELLVIDGTNQLDPAAASVAAIISMLEDGLTADAVVVQPTDIAAVDIATVILAEEGFINSGRRKS